MRHFAALALALALPACASAAPSAPLPASGAPVLFAVPQDKEWYSGSPTGVKEYGREGAYVGISGIMSFEQFDLNMPGVSVDDSSGGLGIRGGWRSKEGVAVEVVAENAMDFTLGSGPGAADLDLWSVGVQGKYYLGHDQVQPYALLGFGWAQSDVHGGKGAVFDKLDKEFDKQGSYVRIGAGVEIYLTPDVAIFGEANYNRLMGGVKDLDHADLQAGFLFRF